VLAAAESGTDFLVRQIDVDAHAIAAEVSKWVPEAERTDVAPSLSPEAKDTLLTAHGGEHSGAVLAHPNPHTDRRGER
jgi:hypothetical protein